MTDRSPVSVARVLLPLLLGLLLTTCGGHQDNDEAALQGVPITTKSTPHNATDSNAALALVSANSSSTDASSTLNLQFNAKLAAAQTFDTLIAVTGPNGEVVSGSWTLQDEGTALSFPFVQANTHYAVKLQPALLATDGRTLGHAVKHDVYSGNLPATAGFASHG